MSQPLDKMNKLRHQLDEQRRVLALKAIQYVQETLPFGAANAPAGYSVISKFHVMMFDSQSSPLHAVQNSKDFDEKKRILNESINHLKALSGTRSFYLELSLAEKKQLRAVISNYLLYRLFFNEMNAPIETIRDLMRKTQLIRIFKTGNCGDQAMVALEYFFRNHAADRALYPIAIFEAHKVNPRISPEGYADPEHSHQTVLLGSVDEKDDPTVCDVWQGKSFLFFKAWQKEAPLGLRTPKDSGGTWDFENSVRLFIQTDPRLVQQELAAALKQKPIDFGVTATEVTQWVEDIYGLLTQKPTLSAMPRYSVAKLTNEQRVLIAQRKGKIVEETAQRILFEIPAEALKKQTNGGIREALGLVRGALSDKNPQKILPVVKLLKERVPGITIEIEPKNQPIRYVFTYEQQYETQVTNIVNSQLSPPPKTNTVHDFLPYQKTLQKSANAVAAPTATATATPAAPKKTLTEEEFLKQVEAGRQHALLHQ